MYRQNAAQALHFAMVTVAGAADAAANLSANRLLDAAAMASCTGNVINNGNGAYTLVMSSADCNASQVGIFFLAPGDVPLCFTFPATPANPYDVTDFGLTALPSVAPGTAGGLLIAGSNAGTVTIGALVLGSSLSIGNAFKISGTPDVAQTGDAFARLGVAGVGLTNLGDTRIARLDSAVSTRLGAADARLNTLDSAISTRMATFSLPTNFGALGISAGGKINGVILADTLTTYTGNTPQTGDAFALIGPAGANLTSISLNSIQRIGIADALLDRDLALGSDLNTHSTRNALRFLRNSWSLAAGTLTVTKEDQTTPAWTATVGTTPGVDPVTSNTTT